MFRPQESEEPPSRFISPRRRQRSESKQHHPGFFFPPSVLFLFVCLDVLIYRLVVTAHFVDPEPSSAGFCSQQPVPWVAVLRYASLELFLMGPLGALHLRPFLKIHIHDSPVYVLKGEALPHCLTQLLPLALSSPRAHLWQRCCAGYRSGCPTDAGVMALKPPDPQREERDMF